MTTIDKVRDLMNQQQELLEEAIALFHCESNNSYIFCFALNQETTIERRYRADRIMQKKHEFLTRFQKIKINLAEYFPEEAISKMETTERKCKKCGYQYSSDDKIFADEAHICPKWEDHKEEEKPSYCKTCLSDTAGDLPCRQHGKDICCKCHDRATDKRIERYRREEQTDSVEGCAYELKLEIEDYEREEKFESKNIVEDMLQKKLARFADKAQNLVNALEEEEKKERDSELEVLMKEIKAENRGWNRCYEELMRKFDDEKQAKKESMNDQTIPQTPVSGISGYTGEKPKFFTNPAHGIKDDFGNDTNVASKSIWKDVSESPEVIDEDGILKLDNGKYAMGTYDRHRNRWYALNILGDVHPVKVVTLTDFITDYESEKKAIVELEGRVGKLEKTIFEVTATTNPFQ